MNLPGNVGWVSELIPDLQERTGQFVVDTDELDEELIEVFFEEIRRLADELKEGANTDDMEMIRQAAHSIKGMGGTLGLPEISVLGQQIELDAKTGDMPRCTELIDGLIKWLTEFE